MIKIPIDGQWRQPNNNEITGSVFASKNINFDEQGIAKLSRRTFQLYSNTNDSDFGVPLSFGRKGVGSFLAVTSDDPFTFNITDTAITIAQDADTGVQAQSVNSFGKWWQNRWYTTNQTTTYYKSGTTWTNASVSLTTGVAHPLEVFANKNTMCIGNGNVVKQINTSHSTTTDLTLPTDYEVVGLSYGSNRMGIVTRLGNSTEGYNQDAYFFVWDGATAEANGGFPIGSDVAISVVAYKSGWVVLTRKGQLLYFNGAGFEQLAAFPFYYKNVNVWGFLNKYMYGDSMVVDGDRIYINTNFFANYNIGTKLERDPQNCPSGVWCYDPFVGLYHRYALSRSTVQLYQIAALSVNNSDQTIDFGADIPTGTEIMYVARPSNSQIIVPLSLGTVYFAININSTKVQLATSYENAVAGTPITLIENGANFSYFLVSTKYDYGVSATTGSVGAGGIGLVGENSLVLGEMLIGGSINYDLTGENPIYNVCGVLNSFNNIGYIVTPKIYSQSVTDVYDKVYIKHKKLTANDKITVKYRVSEVDGLPVSTRNKSGRGNSSGEWDRNVTLGPTNYFNFLSNLRDALNAFESGFGIEMEVTSGARAGEMFQLENLEFAPGNYSFIGNFNNDDTEIAAANDSQFEANFDHWESAGTVTATTETNDSGFSEIVLPDVQGKFIQLKIIMRGNGVQLQEVQIVQRDNKRSM